jgi:pimeloyl-ACP methyl ester carboxylesterase
MHRLERRLTWVSVAVLAVCALGATDAAWPSDANVQADAVVQQVVQQAGIGSVLALPPSPSGATAATPPAAAPADENPQPPAVNVIEVTATDGARSFPVTVWYPTAPGRYPLVVLAHGFGASASTYEDMEAQLAAAGFVVAAPDFPFTSSRSQWLDRGDVVNQAGDVSALITQLLDPATAPEALRGTIAQGPVGVIGHSDGGITAAAVSYNSSVADPRVGAAVILSGAEIMYGGPWFTTASPPLLAIHGDADGVNPYWSSEQLFADATGPRWLVAVRGGGHEGPFTNGSVEPEVAALIADFLHAQLQLDAAAAARIDGDANADGLALVGAS